MRDGLKVVVFEQTAKVLEERFGFRVDGVRLAAGLPRVPDHPLLAGRARTTCATGAAKRRCCRRGLTYTLRPRYGPDGAVVRHRSDAGLALRLPRATLPRC